MKKKTPPPVPDHIDLRDYDFFPLYIERLFNSRFHMLARNADAWRAGVILWIKSWHQEPAGTLPESDQELMWLAEIQDSALWLKIRDIALLGWNSHGDARLYHKALTNIVLLHDRKKRHASKHASVAAQARWAQERAKKTTKKRVKKHKVNAPSMPEQCSPMQGKGREGKGREYSTTPAAAAPRPPVDKSTPKVNSIVFMQYPVVQKTGGPATIDVTEERVMLWESTFPKVDVRQKMRELQLWAQDNPDRRKTPEFALTHLSQCLERQQRRAELEQYSSVPIGAFLPRGPNRRDPVSTKHWWETSTGIEAKGAELGLVPEAGVPFPYFKDKVFEAAGPGPWNKREREKAIATELLDKATKEKNGI